MAHPRTQFKCETCGATVSVAAEQMRRRKSNNCKACQSRATGRKNATHGMRRHPLYQVYTNMMQRCHNPNSDKYLNWGGRGIAVCAEWRDDREVFWAWCFANGWERGLTIDRADNDGNYEPANCRMVDMAVQSNNRRDNRPLTFRGETKNLGQWATAMGMKPVTIANRIAQGYSLADALTLGPKGKAANWITWGGETLAAGQWDRKRGWTQGTVRHRIKAGWELSRALTEEPIRKNVRRG